VRRINNFEGNSDFFASTYVSQRERNEQFRTKYSSLLKWHTQNNPSKWIIIGEVQELQGSLSTALLSHRHDDAIVNVRFLIILEKII
jgi:hypothetical protein